LAILLAATHFHGTKIIDVGGIALSNACDFLKTLFSLFMRIRILDDILVAYPLFLLLLLSVLVRAHVRLFFSQKRA